MIYADARNKEFVLQLRDRLIETNLSYLENKELLERCHQLLIKESKLPESYNLALSVICQVADRGVDDSLLRYLLHDCIVQSRVFLYDRMLGEHEISSSDYVSLEYPSLEDEIAKEFYTREESSTILTRDQHNLLSSYLEKKRIVVSAPTSFGKSRIIQEILIKCKYNNIVIVLPTIALLNETFVTFKSNPIISKRYHLYNSIGARDQSFHETNNLFILTPEKTEVLLDMDKGFEFDFFTMDEIYKIQDDDGRGKVFTNCLYRLSKIPNIEFYLIGPYYSGFSQNFIERTNSSFKKYDSEIVQKKEIDVNGTEQKESYQVEGRVIKKLANIKLNLRNIFQATSGQSIVYRGKRVSYAESTAIFLSEYGKREVDSEFMTYLGDIVGTEWSLIKCLRKGIAFHHGQLPKYIQTEIVDMFNGGELDAIVCTATIVEGVNTTAKNVIIYDQYKGDSILSGFDVKNIKGRAGRFLSHFVGNVYPLVPLQSEENKGEIEFKYYDRDDLEPEATLQMDREDLEGNNLKVRENAENVLEKNNIPIEIVRSNKFLPIHKQLSLVKVLRYDIERLKSLRPDGNIPTTQQLEVILQLCHEYLFNEQDKENRNYTIGQLIRLTKFYVYRKPRLKEIIKEQKSEYFDTKVRSAFRLISYYFEFAIPKYLTVFENLYDFVYREKIDPDFKGINLSFLLSILEFGHSTDYEIAMKEAGVPSEIIKKISDRFNDCSNIEEIRNKNALNPNLTNGLSSIEKKIFNRYI